MPVAPNPIDLTTVANLKAWLGAPGSQSDDVMQRAITNVSRFIITNISRGILPADYAERYDGLGGPSGRLILDNWPVLSVSQVSIGNSLVTAMQSTGVGFSGSGYLLSPADAWPPGSQQWLDFGGWCLPRGSQNIGVSYRAGYATVETWTIPGTPYQVTPNLLLGRWGSDEGVRINGMAAVRVAVGPMAGQYAIAFTDGVPTYQFAAANAGLAAQILYGYVPQDIEQAALEMIALRFKSRDFIGLVSKSLGGNETVTFSQKDMSAAVSTMLQSYKRVF